MLCRKRVFAIIIIQISVSDWFHSTSLRLNKRRPRAELQSVKEDRRRWRFISEERGRETFSMCWPVPPEGGVCREDLEKSISLLMFLFPSLSRPYFFLRYFLFAPLSFALVILQPGNEWMINLMEVLTFFYGRTSKATTHEDPVKTHTHTHLNKRNQSFKLKQRSRVSFGCGHL